MPASPKLSYSHLLARSWPIILANASVPLLGLVDTAVIGNLGAVIDLGAIAFGALVFSFVYWSFGFLRMSTTGFVARAAGVGDESEIRAVLGRALVLAIVLGLLLIALQWPLKTVAFVLLDGSVEVEAIAQQYFDIRIWGAPATLGTFCLMGVLVGLGMSRMLLLVQLFLNGLNALLDIYFAGVLGMGARGIALGTVLAEWSTLVVGGSLILFELRKRMESSQAFWDISRLLQRESLAKTLSANGDIMLRTLVLVFSFAFFTNQSARFGDIILAANHILMQLVAFSAFFLDGYAFVAEAVVGSSIGAGRRDRFDMAVKKTTILAAVTAVILAVAIWQAGSIAVALLTDLENVRFAANQLLYLAAIYVFLSFPAFQLDGIFIGASFTREMRNAAFMSFAVFIISWWLLMDRMGITGLWFAMIIYVAARADALLLYYRRLRLSIIETWDQ